MVEPASSLSLPVSERLIVALDFPLAQPALAFLADLRARCAAPPVWVKVGLELFIAAGPPLLHRLNEQGYRIFLDLKLHDIPNTVAAAVRAACALPVDLLTVHAAGGPSMLGAAAAAADQAPGGRAPGLLAVTVLTSVDQAQLNAIGVPGQPKAQVMRLARMAIAAGIRGLVASPLEAAALRFELGPELCLVTPGIRPAGTLGGDDQQRVATPGAALAAGASRLVVGRPVTQAADPAAALDAIFAEIEQALDAAKPGVEAPGDPHSV